MLLTKKTEYALLSLISMANSQKAKNVDELSSELGISKSFLAKVLQSLAKNQIVNSYKGANGGFSLSRPAEKISIYEITLAAEEKMPSVFECTPSPCNCPTNSSGGCFIWPVLSNLQFKINNFLNDMTLKDLLG